MNPDLTPLDGWLHQAERFLRRFVVLSDDQACAVVLWARIRTASRRRSRPHISGSRRPRWSRERRACSSAADAGRAPLVHGPHYHRGPDPQDRQGDAHSAARRRRSRLQRRRRLRRGAARGAQNWYRKGGAVTVCVGQGANLDIRDLSSFCPKAIAGIGDLPDTVQSRSIPIRLKGRLATEPVERFRERKARDVGDGVRDGLEIAVEKLLDDLEHAEPELPDELSDRAQDVWEPLLAIADAAGGEWPARARAAAVRQSRQREPDEATLGVRVLADIREAFGDSDRLTTKELLAALHGMEEAPWGDWYGKPLSAQKLGKLLRPFRDQEPHGVAPRRQDGEGLPARAVRGPLGAPYPCYPPLRNVNASGWL